MRQKMNEDELQKGIVDLSQQLGWKVYWLPDWMYRLAIQSMKRFRRGDREWSPPGFPDLVMVQGLGDSRTPVRLIFAELKSDKGVVRWNQQQWLKALNRVSGIEVYVWRPDDWHGGTIDRILQNGPMPEHPGTEKELARVIHKPKEGANS